MAELTHMRVRKLMVRDRVYRQSKKGVGYRWGSVMQAAPYYPGVTLWRVQWDGDTCFDPEPYIDGNESMLSIYDCKSYQQTHGSERMTGLHPPDPQKSYGSTSDDEGDSDV